MIARKEHTYRAFYRNTLDLFGCILMWVTGNECILFYFFHVTVSPSFYSISLALSILLFCTLSAFMFLLFSYFFPFHLISCNAFLFRTFKHTHIYIRIFHLYFMSIYNIIHQHFRPKTFIYSVARVTLGTTKNHLISIPFCPPRLAISIFSATAFSHTVKIYLLSVQGKPIA